MTLGLVAGLIVVAMIAGLWVSRREEGVLDGHGAQVRFIVYWLLTLVVAFELAAGALWDLLRIEYVRVVLAHLGYPVYLLIILGVWRIPGALALLVPRFPRLKEWAYAGAFFNYSGAAASHFLAGDPAAKWVGPVVLSALTLISWALRPASRRLPASASATERRVEAWIIPVAIVAAMLVVAFVTQQQGAPAK